MSENSNLDQPYTEQNFHRSPIDVSREFQRGLLRHEALITKIEAAIERIDEAISHFKQR